MCYLILLICNISITKQGMYPTLYLWNIHFSVWLFNQWFLSLFLFPSMRLLFSNVHMRGTDRAARMSVQTHARVERIGQAARIRHLNLHPSVLWPRKYWQTHLIYSPYALVGALSVGTLLLRLFCDCWLVIFCIITCNQLS